MSSNDIYAGRDLEALGHLPNYYAWIFEYFRPYVRGQGIEFGAGMGTFSAVLEPFLERLDLVEPSPNLSRELARRFGNNPRITVFGDTLANHAGGLADRSQDTVVLVNVLEHIEDDDGALAEFFRILRPGGHLLLFVPALAFLFSAFDHTVGHHRRYRLKPLRRQVESIRFEVSLARYFDFLGILPWWLINKVGGKTELDPRMTGYYDRLAVPIVRPVERWITPALGKNILLVAQRPL